MQLIVGESLAELLAERVDQRALVAHPCGHGGPLGHHR